MFSRYLIIPIALFWTLNLVCIFPQVPCSQMSTMLQLRTYLGWVGGKEYSYSLEKTLLFLHPIVPFSIFTTVRCYWLVFNLWSTKLPHPFLLSSCCLASHPPCCIWVHDSSWRKINFCTKPYRLASCLVFWRLWLSKITLNLTLVFQGAWKPFQLGDVFRLNAQMLWPIIQVMHEIGNSSDRSLWSPNLNYSLLNTPLQNV